MAGKLRKPIQVKPTLSASIKHPIKVARTLYTPPPFVLRGPIYVVGIILLVTLVYSFWAEKEILVVAPLVLERQTLVIEAVGSGMIERLPVKENQTIKSGEKLVIVQGKIGIGEVSGKESLEGQLYEMEKAYSKLEEEFNFKISQLQLDLQDFTTSGSSQKTAQSGKVKQVKQQLSIARRAKKRRDGQLSLARIQLARKKRLYNRRDITISEYERAQEKVSDLQKAADDAQAEIAKIRVSLQTEQARLAELSDLNRKEKLDKELAQTRQRRRRELNRAKEQIASIKRSIGGSNKLVTGVSYVGNSAVYASTFDGVVTKVHVKRGEIITPGTPLVTIVKESAVLEARALVANRDIGNLRRGQPVKIKYYAYPYQEYGIHKGRISSIAKTPDAGDEQSRYIIKIALEQDSIRKRGGTDKSLEIGLEGLAEIKTGAKRFIELVFSPISKFLGKD